MKTRTNTDQNQLERTVKGDDIAGEIQGETCYGHDGELTAADMWNILDNLHSHFCETGNKTLQKLCTQSMNRLETLYPNIERY